MTAPTKNLYDQVYEEYLTKAKDPAWKLAMTLFLGELMDQNASYHQAQLQAIADWAAERQLNRAKTSITKRYLIERLVEVRKNTNTQKPPTNFWNEVYWQRDPEGHFARYIGPGQLRNRSYTDKNGRALPSHLMGTPGHDVKAVIAQNVGMNPELRGTQAAALGVLTNPIPLRVEDRDGKGISQGQHRVDVAHKFNELTYQLSQMTGNEGDKQRVQFVISSPDGHHRVTTPTAGTMPQIDYGKGERVSFMTPVGPDHPVTMAGHALNIGYVAGMSPEAAAKTGAVAEDIHSALHSVSWGQKLQSTANAIRVISDNHPLAVQAHAVASLFHILGPEASRAFGNKLKQLTYRYMGQESPPERWSDVAKRGRAVDSQGNQQAVREYEHQLMADLVPAIPSASQYKLALEAGSTPPSRGYILNDEGRVVSEATGYADDWYAPFNLRKLPKMSGGSYIRTRGYGGLTPEDIRLAMQTGAKRATVISNNGVFTMEFQPKALHWGHRLGFAGGGMIRRYAKALDAIQGGGVALPDGEEGTMDLNTVGYKAAMRDLQMANPYYIVAPNDQVPFHEEIGHLGLVDRQEKIGESANDAGYLGPLDIHAKKARAGWHDTNARELFSDRAGKYRYDEIARGQLLGDRLFGVTNALREDTPGRSTSRSTGSTGPDGGREATKAWYVDPQGLRKRKGSNDYVDELGNLIGQRQAEAMRERLRRNGHGELTRPNAGYDGTTDSWGSGDAYQVTTPVHAAETRDPTRDIGSTRENAGAARYERAYSESEKARHWNIDEARQVVNDVQRVLAQARHQNILPANVDHFDHLGPASDMLFPEPGSDPATDNDRFEYLVRQVAREPKFRQGLANDLEEAIGGHTISGNIRLAPGEVLAQLRETDAEAEDRKEDAFAPSEATSDLGDTPLEGAPLLLSQLNNSDAVIAHHKALRNTKKNDANEDARTLAAADLEDYQAFKGILNQLEQTHSADAKRGRLRSVGEILSEEKLDIYNRLNPYYSSMIRNGVRAPGDTFVDAGRFRSDLPVGHKRVRVQDVESGSLSPQSIAWEHYADLQESPNAREELKEMEKKYRYLASKKSPELAQRYLEVADHLNQRWHEHS